MDRGLLYHRDVRGSLVPLLGARPQHLLLWPRLILELLRYLLAHHLGGHLAFNASKESFQKSILKQAVSPVYYMTYIVYIVLNLQIDILHVLNLYNIYII